MTQPNPLSEKFVKYLEGRDKERLDAAAKMWGNLSEREQMLVKEAAVMGFVQGNLVRPKDRSEFPHDRDIVIRVLTHVRSVPDLYPNLAALEDL